MNVQQHFQYDLVLAGGGHSHLAVIRRLAMHPLPGVRVTLVSIAGETAYSGMLPGVVAGLYSIEQAQIDLRRLCEKAGVRFFQCEVTAIDADTQTVFCAGRPPLRYDWLSINTGSQPAVDSIAGAASHGIALKPIETFLEAQRASFADIIAKRQPAHVVIVGGGAASVEITLGLQQQWQQNTRVAETISWQLVCGSDSLLPTHNAKVQQHMARELASRGIQLDTGIQVIEANTVNGKTELLFNNGECRHADLVIWAIHAGSPQWTGDTGLTINEHGFIRVNHYLQSTSHNNVFAAGDIADFTPTPIAKSGVYAVREGKVLADNLYRAIKGKQLRPYRPQKRFLSLLITGQQQAVASYGSLYAAGHWIWRLKDLIDRRFIDSFNQLPAMSAHTGSNGIRPGPALPKDELQARCGGCGAKVPAPVLERVLQRLQETLGPETISTGAGPEDAAVIEPPAGQQWLQTVDYFRAFIDDPYLLGKIATNHCLGDIYAMGGAVHSALAIATIPHANEKIVEDTLYQLMLGAAEALQQDQATLLGGHSSEGTELGFGLSVNGVVDKNELLRKGNLPNGSQLVLCKPLGTGTILAANMAGSADSRWVDAALVNMQTSNREAATLFQQFAASACTDITGFGLLGHLIEMLDAGSTGARLALNSLPLLAGTRECFSMGWQSTLHAANEENARRIVNAASWRNRANYPVLFDPQTAGGLLAAVPAEVADDCVVALRQAGYAGAVVIGVVDLDVGVGRLCLK